MISIRSEFDQYYIMDMKLKSDENIVFVEIVLGRRLLSIIMTIYVTTFLMGVIGHSAVHYRDVYFESQISMNVTIMLVQVTVYTSVSLYLNLIYLLGRY